MQKKKMINEIFLMRSISCLSILLLHSLARAYYDDNNAVNFVRVLLTFGTPTFIFISEFILAKSYPNELPTHFWTKRFKYIFVPFVIFGTIYAVLKGFQDSLSSGENFIGLFGHYLWRHLLIGDFHGYFILVIFQFYLLHYLLNKYLKKWSPLRVMVGSFLINFIYLGFFNFAPPYQTEIGIYVWKQFYWIPFFAWIFYFTLAYYCANYFSYFISLLTKHSKLVIASPLVFGTVCILLYYWQVIPSISSKRIDMLFFTTSMIFFIYYLAFKTSKVPRMIVKISQYSFGIYLLHPFFLAILFIAFNSLDITIPPLVLTIVYFLTSLLLSMFSTFILNYIPYGHFIAGKIGVGSKEKESESSYSSKTTTHVKVL